ncbi:hypothetical protein BEL04_21580 [Mucilaginibacter sp. PPCGB 2223]|nr:hypothetical protein BEL04_21580 [Mucilaginibacter sp. PPCGB 2223]
MNDKENGKYQYFFPNGKVQSEVNYLNGEYDGKYLSYFETGQLRTDREYTKGKLNGLFLSYYPDGKKKREDHFKNDKLTEGQCFTHSGADTSYFPFMVPPEFIGGEKACGKYIRDNLKYPEAAKQNNVTGKVYISFNIDPNGDLVDAEVTRGADPLLDDAALAIVKTMPKWKPGKMDGQPESIKFTLPINFSLGN